MTAFKRLHEAVAAEGFAAFVTIAQVEMPVIRLPDGQSLHSCPIGGHCRISLSQHEGVIFFRMCWRNANDPGFIGG